jgi:hypothetical protein
MALPSRLVRYPALNQSNAYERAGFLILNERTRSDAYCLLDSPVEVVSANILIARQDLAR